jgi:hypothetical protein
MTTEESGYGHFDIVDCSWSRKGLATACIENFKHSM